eukprot:2227330-Heterocapsa_arctica.AAC.1
MDWQDGMASRAEPAGRFLLVSSANSQLRVLSHRQREDKHVTTSLPYGSASLNRASSETHTDMRDRRWTDRACKKLTGMSD